MLEEVNKTLFQRYLSIIEQQNTDEVRGRLTLNNLDWMCRTALSTDLPVDKASRWLGFVQACLAMRGLIDVDVERDFSRPLFHAAYGEATATLEAPKSVLDVALRRVV